MSIRMNNKNYNVYQIIDVDLLPLTININFSLNYALYVNISIEYNYGNSGFVTIQ